MSKITKENRIAQFDEIVKGINRDGLGELREFLIKSDFFTAPASSMFHCNYEGGLFDHSVNVARYATILAKINEVNWGVAPPETESLIVAGLFHDLCKVDTYFETTKYFKPERDWIKYKGYEIKEVLPLGHGPKSLYIVSNFIKLTDDEALAILHHMGFYIQSAHIAYPEGMALQEASKRYLVKLIQCADGCSGMVEATIDYKDLAYKK